MFPWHILIAGECVSGGSLKLVLVTRILCLHVVHVAGVSPGSTTRHAASAASWCSSVTGHAASAASPCNKSLVKVISKLDDRLDDALAAMSELEQRIAALRP